MKSLELMGHNGIVGKLGGFKERAKIQLGKAKGAKV